MTTPQQYLDMATRVDFAHPDEAHFLAHRLRCAASQQCAFDDGASNYCPPNATLCCQYGQALAAAQEVAQN